MDYSQGLFFKNEEMMKEAINILKDKGFDFEKCSSYKAICFEEADCVIPEEEHDFKYLLSNNLNDENNISKIAREKLVKDFAWNMYEANVTIVDEEWRSAVLSETIEELEKDIEEGKLC